MTKCYKSESYIAKQVKTALKNSADKTFVSTYKHLVSTVIKLRLTRGLNVIGAGVLTTYRKTLLKLFVWNRTFEIR